MAEIVMDSPSENLIALFIKFERTSKILILSANTVIGSSCDSKTMSMGVDEFAMKRTKVCFSMDVFNHILYFFV